MTGAGRKQLGVLAALTAGAVAFTYLVTHFGIGAVLAAMARVGWSGFWAMILLHLSLILPMGTAWYLLGRSQHRGRVTCFIWGRLIRDAAAEALPLSQLGGIVLGARAASLCGVPGSFAIASTAVDLGVELSAKLPYTVLGLCLLIGSNPNTQLVIAALLGLIFTAGAVAAFVALQAKGAKLMDRLAERLVGSRIGNGQSGALHDTIQQIRSGPLWPSFLIHCTTWILSGVEVLVPLWFMGVKLGLGEAIAIDSLISGIRSAAFFIPHAIGIQEGAYVLMFGVFGVDPQVALALSMLRRGRDIAIAIPALFVLQVIEGRRAWRGTAP